MIQTMLLSLSPPVRLIEWEFRSDPQLILWYASPTIVQCISYIASAADRENPIEAAEQLSAR